MTSDEEDEHIWPVANDARASAIVALAIALSACSSKETQSHRIAIEAVDDGDGLYKVTVYNQEQSSIELILDSSSYADASGKSMGRLIRGETRRMDIGKLQPPVPIAPGSNVTETVIPEGYAGDRPPPGPDGKLYLTFTTNAGRFTWSGSPTLASDMVALKSGYYCTTPIEQAGEEFCSRVPRHCENGRRTGARMSTKTLDQVMTRCTRVATAQCFDLTPKPVGGIALAPMAECSASKDACERARNALSSSGTAGLCEERD